jgi:hypothetical protein
LHLHGEAGELAASLRTALATTKTPLTNPASSPAPSGPPPDLGFDHAMAERGLGYKGKANAGVYAFNIRRADPVKDDGMDVPEGLGSAIAINLQASGNDKIAGTGDFVLTAAEVNPVITALAEAGIEITALHKHMLNDEPRLFFMHFWANQDAQALAKTLRGALDRMNNQRP